MTAAAPVQHQASPILPVGDENSLSVPAVCLQETPSSDSVTPGAPARRNAPVFMNRLLP
jgi:hypothetical protein